MIEITNDPYGRCGFHFNGVGCVIADSAGDFVISIRGEDDLAKVGFSMAEGKRLISILRSRGGSRFAEERTRMGDKFNVPSNGWAAVKTKPNGDVEFTGQGSFGGVFTVEEGKAVLHASDALYGLCKVTIKAADVPDLIDAMSRLVATRPASIDKSITFEIGRITGETFDFEEEVNDLLAKCRYREAFDLYHDKMSAYHKVKEAEHEAWVAALSPDELAAYKVRRAETARSILAMFDKPLGT
jgi:hypothetical protein